MLSSALPAAAGTMISTLRLGCHCAAAGPLPNTIDAANAAMPRSARRTCITAVVERTSVARAIASNRQAPRIARVHVVHDVELDSVGVDVLPLLLRFRV